MLAFFIEFHCQGTHTFGSVCYIILKFASKQGCYTNNAWVHCVKSVQLRTRKNYVVGYFSRSVASLRSRRAIVFGINSSHEIYLKTFLSLL